MPVSINPVQRRQEADPLEKLATAVGIAKTIYGMNLDSKALDLKRDEMKANREKADREDEEKRQKEETDKNDKYLKENTISEKELATKGYSVSDKAQKGYHPVTIMPPGAKTLAEGRQVFIKPPGNSIDALADQLKKQQFDKNALDIEEKKKKLAQPVKREQEFANRFKNIKGQIKELKKLVDEDGTYEAVGSHNRKLQQLIDAVAIDAAKMFDPESVARESEVAAFKNMLFEGGDLNIRNATALELLDNFQNIVEQRAINENMGHLLEGAPGGFGGQNAIVNNAPSSGTSLDELLAEKQRRINERQKAQR